MRNNVFRSFRFEIVLYSLLSLFYAILTEVVFYAIIVFFGKLIVKIQQQNNLSYQEIHNLSNKLLNDNSNLNNSLANKINNSVNEVKVQDHFLSKYLLFIIAISLIIGIALFIMYFLILTKKFTNYIEEIAIGINEISAGDFSYRIDIKNEDEFTLIASRLNKMTDDISRIMDNERMSESTKNDLVVSVAHDLRTPLTSIIGYLELVLKEEGISEESKKRYIEIAYSKSKRLEKMIEDLFAYTKFSFGEVTMNRTEIDLVKFMDQLVDEFYPSFQDYGLEYDFTTNVSTAIVSADGDFLARAFANLISNAIKYGKDGKRVRIRLQKGIDDVAISVINYGELIPEKDIDNIFERFYRVESSRSRETGGTGLGLAIAKRIILMHDGSISAKSDFDGTVFEVSLKLNEEHRVESGKV